MSHDPTGTSNGPPATDGAGSIAAPDQDRALGFLRERIRGGAYVSVVGDCTVAYRGRAASTLDAGRRHVVAKPDGTVLVHEVDGHQPVNWQPPGGSVAVERKTTDDGEDSTDTDDAASGDDVAAAEDDDIQLVLRATRDSPDEELVVRFSAIDRASAFEMGESTTPDTVGTEADLKQYVVQHPDVVEPGLQPLATERETPAGPVDIYAEDRHGRPVVVELKRTRVGPDAVGQLSRYVDALARDLHADADPRGVLVAPSVTDRARQLLAEEGLGLASVDPDRAD